MATFQTVMDVSGLLLEEGFRCVLSHKMQDHVELLFGRIRRMGGLSNNPKVMQFQQAMRGLTLHNFVDPSAAGKCAAQEDDEAGDLLEIQRPKAKPLVPEVAKLPAAVLYALSVENNRSACLDDCLCLHYRICVPETGKGECSLMQRMYRRVSIQ